LRPGWSIIECGDNDLPPHAPPERLPSVATAIRHRIVDLSGQAEAGPLATPEWELIDD
jgi:hypothetical protein